MTIKPVNNQQIFTGSPDVIVCFFSGLSARSNSLGVGFKLYNREVKMEEKKKWRWSLLLMILLAALLVCAGCEPDDDDDDDDDVIIIDDGDNYCLEDITNLRPGAGPFRVSSDTLSVGSGWLSSGRVRVWVPNIPSGCKVPVVHLANGTGATCSMYSSTLENLAEFGFIAACYEDSNTGQGEQAITAVEAVLSEYAHIADPGKIGFTGHSQGGGATFMGVYRAEERWGDSKIYSGLAMQPASGFGDAPLNYASYYAQIDSPMSMFNGTMDTLVYAGWVRDAYEALPRDNFKVWYTATGMDSTHIPVPNGPTREMSIPWFRWTLLGDENACEEFKDLPNQSGWNRAEQANVPSCY